MNFHVDKVRNCIYLGDVNVEYGGTFVKAEGKCRQKLERKILRLNKHEDEFVFGITWLEVNEGVTDNEWYLSEGTGQLVYSQQRLAEALDQLGLEALKEDRLSRDETIGYLYEALRHCGKGSVTKEHQWLEETSSKIVRIGPELHVSVPRNARFEIESYNMNTSLFNVVRRYAKGI